MAKVRDPSIWGWWGAWFGSLVVMCLLVAVIAAAVVAVRRRLARAIVAGILSELASPPTVEGVQAALRRALGDPTAGVLYLLPGSDFYLGADGLRAHVPVVPQRLVLPVLAESMTGEHVAVVHLDPALETDRRRVEVAVTTCRPALANARLQVISRMRVHELRQSRSRIVAAGIEERRRLERNLHDGAQQVLLAVSARLAAARAQVTDEDALGVLDAARLELRGALSDLRALTRDLFPAILASEGLAAALEAAADEQTLHLSLQVTAERFPADVESIAYLTVADLLAALRRHREDHLVSVRVSRDDDFLRIVVEYETLTSEPGVESLTGIADRLRAVDGDLLQRPAETGQLTHLEARIPCE